MQTGLDVTSGSSFQSWLVKNSLPFNASGSVSTLAKNSHFTRLMSVKTRSATKSDNNIIIDREGSSITINLKQLKKILVQL